MNPKKIFIVFSNVSKALAFEWAAEYLNDEKLDIHYILLNNKSTAFENYLIIQKHKVTRIKYGGKFSSLNVLARLFILFLKNKPDVVHCHLFDACVLGLTAAKLASIKKRIYTRHHSTLQHTYYPNGVKYDLWCNKMATHIIAISEVVKRTLIDLEGVDNEKVVLIHHGFDLKKFENISLKRIEHLRERYNIPENAYVVGVISRYLHLKGVTYIIEAFKEVLDVNPNSVLLLANAIGEYSGVIKTKLKSLPENTYFEIIFEEDVFALYKLFNIFIHVPIDQDIEAFGQTYIEALAMGVPSIFTLSGVANEFIVNNYNAIVVKHKNANAIKSAIIELMINDLLCKTLIANGKVSIKQFDMSTCTNKTEELYLS
ncbi:MAG: glycosyltransferase family 4 protein [Bacteroidota bacterium]|jgi:glycosyltransferase involved in cell wall biosynthesis|nr:glycosyltransferase family 4 protein [Bacteroidota bacterium]